MAITYAIPKHSRIIDGGGEIILPNAVLSGFVNLAVPTEADLVTESSIQKYPIGS